MDHYAFPNASVTCVIAPPLNDAQLRRTAASPGRVFRNLGPHRPMMELTTEGMSPWDP
jgi:hypothetical protein